jgi:hypothetical protein
MFGSFLLRFVPWIQFEGVKTGSAVSGTTNSILV